MNNTAGPFPPFVAGFLMAARGVHRSHYATYHGFASHVFCRGRLVAAIRVIVVADGTRWVVSWCRVHEFLFSTWLLWDGSVKSEKGAVRPSVRPSLGLPYSLGTSFHF